MGCIFSGTFSLFGFIFGLITGGIERALYGLLIGTLIDTIIASFRRKKARHYYKSSDFTEHELVLAAYVAKADNNRLMRTELEYVRQFLIQQLGESRAQSALIRFRDILDSDIDINAVCNDLRQHATIYEKLIILQFLFGFSHADGSMNEQEIAAIKHISDLCGIDRSNYEAVKSMFFGRYRYAGSYNAGDYGGYGGGYGGGSSTGSYSTRTASDSDYRILEISPDATDEEVKKAYRAAAKKHHPDKVSHLGEDVRKAAEEKFAQVNEAYERIKKARRIN